MIHDELCEFYNVWYGVRCANPRHGVWIPYEWRPGGQAIETRGEVGLDEY